MVVPTATTRRPAARAAATRAMTARSTTNGSSWSGWSSMRSVVTGLEGGQADVQREVLDGDPRGAQRPVERRGEVQPGGGRRGGPLLPGVDRLVALGVGQRRMDVGRQGRLAVALWRPAPTTPKFSRRFDKD